MATGPTVSDVFNQLNLWQWWTQNNGLGTQMYNPPIEYGIDYAAPGGFGTPIGVPVGGKVVRATYNANAINWQIELQASDGSVWLYQHISSNARVGTTLGVGGIIGTENGLPVTKGISTGPHIEVRYCPPGLWKPGLANWQEPWINPFAIFSTIGNQPAGSNGIPPPPGGGPPPPGGPSGATNPPPPINPLAPNADVTAFLILLDQLEVITNPFLVIGAQQDTLGVFGAGLTFTDPISYLQGVGNNIVSDLVAIIFRLILLALGVFVIYKVLDNFIDFGKIASGAMDAAGKIAMVAA